ncbi:uncharacterized protein DNG_08172 [Cephalotrichum gorgonifer]|uniref:Beta-lactamase-related domain-containing protein n=1 Tax=Cephalotrichum gorgonifer TaxID=2041049 RepID=A0AAE8N619_9PEZI|nr:uncharacterized protein DNG_08172 [Cephalotrichum gorgonifer]
MPQLLSLAALALQLLAMVAPAEAKRKYPCPPLGPVLPAPLSPSSSPSVAAAIDLAKDWFAELTADFEGTAVSLTVKSIHEDAPLLDLHHTPSVSNNRSVAEVNAQTIYRVASVSKIFSSLLPLIAEINLDDPVTKYLPELKELQDQQEVVNELTTIAWDDITVGSLANHMSGFGSEIAIDLSNFLTAENAAAIGLPPVDKSEIPGCSGLQGIAPCTREDFFAIFGKHRPAFAPFTTPMYTNPAYSVLSWVLEAATGKTFESLVQENIFDVAGMPRSTSGKRPEDGTGFIPTSSVWWDGDLGFLAPGGGFYSSTEDLTNLGKAILEHKILSPVETRKWIKPTEHTSALGQSIGGPWEIIRTHKLTTDGRVIDLYTKSGSITDYVSMFVVIPDFDVTFALLMGGPDGSPTTVNLGAGMVSEILIPALDAASKEQARQKLVGTYADEESNSTITLNVDGGPGLLVTDLVMRGVNVIENYLLYAGAEVPTDPSVKIEVTPRLYPSGLQADGEVGFRALFNVGPIEESIAVEKQLSFIPDASCMAFFQFERITYGMNTIEDFVFSVDEDGAVEEVTARFWRVTLGLDNRDVPEIPDGPKKCKRKQK